jgi:hypothetical protein
MVGDEIIADGVEGITSTAMGDVTNGAPGIVRLVGRDGDAYRLP